MSTRQPHPDERTSPASASPAAVPDLPANEEQSLRVKGGVGVSDISIPKHIDQSSNKAFTDK